MDIMTLSILLLIVVVIMGITVALMFNNKSEQKDRELAVIKGRAGAGDGKKTNEKDAQHKRRDELSKKLKEAENEGKSNSKKETMKAKLAQAGLDISVKKFYLFSFLLMVVVVAITTLLKLNTFVVVMLAITAFLGVPRMVIRMKITRRQKKFLEEFSDALEAMVRLLKAGMPVTEAIAMAGREYTGPVGDEMLRIYDAQRVGISLEEAALESARRMPLTEMQMFATGITIQAQTGASLSEVLSNLAGVIRARFRLKRKVKALSSEAKASAMIIGSLPFLVGGGLFGLNPEYMDILINTFVGRILLICGAVWMSLGILVMKMMINFKV